MKIFITGATGYIGTNLALRLANSGHIVHALYRSLAKTSQLKHKNIKLFHGNISDIESLERAMQSCEYVYHVAGFAQAWAKNPKTFYDLNVLGSLNVVNTANKLGVKKIVFTSTAGVFGPSTNGTINEESKRAVNFFTEYESSKSKAEEKLLELVSKGQNIVIVNPTRVYGPGLLSVSNSVTKMIKLYIEGKFHIIPGNGKSIGNYVFIDDVVEGHILAMEKGKPGEKYILGGTNASYNEFFETLINVSQKKYFLFKLPLFFMVATSNLMILMPKLFGKPPLITPAIVRRLLYNWYVTSNKAVNKLGYKITPLAEGMKKTLNWLESEHNCNRSQDLNS